MDVSKFILRKMEEKGKNKKTVYEAINMSRQTFDNRLDSGKFFIDEFLDIARFLGIEPGELWEEWKLSRPFIASEPNGVYQKITKNTNSSLVDSNHTIQELLKQNGVLVDVIDRLTKGK